MNLSIKDRIVFNILFPESSDIVTQVMVKDIEEKIKLTSEEMIKVGLRVTPQGSTWNQEAANKMGKNVQFTNAELSLLKDRVDELDKQKKVTRLTIDLILKIKDEETKKEGE